MEPIILNKAFTTIIPDITGRGFSFSLPRRGYRKHISVDSVELLTASISQRKTSLPLLEGQSSLEETICFADFDYLPTDISTSWNRLYTTLKELVRERGIVFQSVSGKVKIAYRLIGKWNEQEVLTFLKEELPFFYNMKAQIRNEQGEIELKNCIDKKPTALFTCFCNSEIINQIKRQWKIVKQHIKTVPHTIHISLPITDSKETIEPVIKPKHPWKFYEGSLPDDLKLGETFEKGIRWLLSWSKKSVIGIDCPINYIAGCLKKDTAQTSRLLHTFEEKGLIELVSDSGGRFFNGKKWYTKAKTYKISGILLKIAEQIIKAFKNKNNINRSICLPERLMDGQAHSTLFDIAKAFKGNLDAFKRQMGKTYGIYDKNRWSEGIKIWEWLNEN